MSGNHILTSPVIKRELDINPIFLLPILLSEFTTEDCRLIEGMLNSVKLLCGFGDKMVTMFMQKKSIVSHCLGSGRVALKCPSLHTSCDVHHRTPLYRHY